MADAEKLKRKVFISYAHESTELRNSVRALADWLGQQGCEVWTDHPYVDRPPELGWIAWMERCIADADVVLIVCTQNLKDRWAKRENPEFGRGATFEGAIAAQHLYDNAMRNKKVYPVIPDGGSYDHVPDNLRPWWCGHQFPSEYTRFRGLIFEQATKNRLNSGKSTGDAAEIKSAKNVESDRWVENQHRKRTADLLAEPGASPFLNALLKRLAAPFNPQHAFETPNDIVTWLSDGELDEGDVRKVFGAVRDALRDLGSSSRIVDRPSMPDAEAAAAACYCLAASRLVDHAEHSADTYLLRVPRSAPIIYAVITTALFGGELRLRPSREDPDLPCGDHIYQIDIGAGIHQIEKEFERAAYLALFRCVAQSTKTSLHAGALSEDEREELLARLETIRDRERQCLALVVAGIPDGDSLRRSATELQVPVMIPDDLATTLLSMRPTRLKALIKEFWADLRTHQGSQSLEGRELSIVQRQPKPSAEPGATYTFGDHATVVIGDHGAAGSAAQTEHNQGLDPGQLEQVLQTLLHSIRNTASPYEREALKEKLSVVEEEAKKEQPEVGRIQSALEAIYKTTKKSGETLQSGEKIAQTCQGAYKSLAPFFGWPSLS